LETDNNKGHLLISDFDMPIVLLRTTEALYSDGSKPFLIGFFAKHNFANASQAPIARESEKIPSLRWISKSILNAKQFSFCSRMLIFEFA